MDTLYNVWSFQIHAQVKNIRFLDVVASTCTLKLVAQSKAIPSVL